MFNFVMHFIVKKSHDYTFIASAFVENYFQTWIKTHWCPQKYLYHEVSPNVIDSKLPAVPMFSMKERVTEYNYWSAKAQRNKLHGHQALPTE